MRGGYGEQLDFVQGILFWEGAGREEREKPRGTTWASYEKRSWRPELIATSLRG